MATTNGTLVLPNVGLNDVPKSAEEKKRLMEMLLDPRVVSLAESSPETKKAIAGVVRKLQAERAKRRDDRYRSPERKDEEAWGSKFMESFGCGPILRLFTGPTQKMPKRRGSALSVRHAVLSTENCQHGKVNELQKVLPDPTGKPIMKPTNGSVVLCSRSDLNSIPLNLNGITIHVNGTDIPSSAALRKKYKDFAEILLQKASIGSSAALLNLLPSENKVHLAIVHDLGSNVYTNRKFIRATALPTTLHSAIIVFQPAKVIEVPVYHIRELPDPFNKRTSYAASSTQTDLSGELCDGACSCEYDDTNYKLDVQGNPKYRQVVEVAQKLASMASGYSSSYICSNKRFFSPKRESDPYNLSKGMHCSEDEYISSGESEVDPFDLDSGGRYLSKVIRYSKGPNKDLVSPEIIITYSGITGCQGKCSDCDSTSCGSYDGCCKKTPSSSETVLDGTQHSNKWPRKRMMLTSCDSYYDEDSDFKERNSRKDKNVTCQSSDQMTTQSDFNQGPPEISTGYSQLSYRDAKGYYSESTPDCLERNRDTEKLRYRSSEMCAVGTRDEIVSRQLSIRESSVSSFQSDGELVAEHLLSIVSSNFIRNAEHKKKIQECPEMRCRTVDIIPRRSTSSFCIFQESPSGRASEPDKPSDNVAQETALDEVQLSEISSQDLQTVYVAERCSDGKELNSSEEEQKRQYEKNLKTMRMRALNDKDISVSSIEEPQWTARKVKHKPSSKTKDKSRHKTCSIM